MSNRINGPVCLTHPNTAAVAHCAVCRRPLCAKCIAKRRGTQAYCSEACYKSGLDSEARVDGIKRRGASAQSAALVRKIIGLVILLALIAIGYWFYAKNKSAIDSKIKQGGQQIEQNIKKGKKQVDDNLIKDSKYKREREQMVNEL